MYEDYFEIYLCLVVGFVLHSPFISLYLLVSAVNLTTV